MEEVPVLLGCETFLVGGTGIGGRVYDLENWGRLRVYRVCFS